MQVPGAAVALDEKGRNTILAGKTFLLWCWGEVGTRVEEFARIRCRSSSCAIEDPDDMILAGEAFLRYVERNGC